MSLKRTYSIGRVAGGNHLTADSDEPEPGVIPESEWIAADIERDANKAARRVARDVRAGVEEQAQWWGWPL